MGKEKREMEILLREMVNEELAANVRVQLMPLVNTGSFKELLVEEVARRLENGRD